jgi:hypothetical protein
MLIVMMEVEYLTETKEQHDRLMCKYYWKWQNLDVALTTVCKLQGFKVCNA